MTTIALRGKTDRDIPLVFKSWIKGATGDPALARIPFPTMAYYHHRLIESAWDDPGCTWLFAVSATDPSFVLGFLCGQVMQAQAGVSPVVHWVYVKKAFRRVGVASRLLATFGVREGIPVLATSSTPKWALLAGKVGAVSLYNPYLFMGRAPVPGVLPAPKPSQREAKYNAAAMAASRASLQNLDRAEEE
jgi:GNAT superfamily N-acetyltransferase